MSGRIIAGAVLLLVVVVGGIFLFIGSQEGGDVDTGSLGVAHSLGHDSGWAAADTVPHL